MSYSGIFSKIAGAVKQQIGEIVIDDNFQIGHGESTEDMVERVENLAILSVSEDLQIGSEIVLACYFDNKNKNSLT